MTPCLLIWKEGLWRVVYRNNIRLKVRTYWDYWCLNKPRCIVSSVFISTFFNVNLDETVDTHTHTHTQYTWILHVCTLDTKWQTYVKNVTCRIPTWICVRLHICTFWSSVCTQFTIVSNTHAIYLHACGGLNTDVCSHNICIHVINNLSLSLSSTGHYSPLECMAMPNFKCFIFSFLFTILSYFHKRSLHLSLLINMYIHPPSQNNQFCRNQWSMRGWLISNQIKSNYLDSVSCDYWLKELPWNHFYFRGSGFVGSQNFPVSCGHNFVGSKFYIIW